MGVLGLTALLSRYAPNSVINVNASTFVKQSIAIDASCHLNKFVFGEEPHPHRHIYGFYQLARFCDLNRIKPIFVFDGPFRIAAKKLEHAKRARTRYKVKHSLLFEKQQSQRLDSWLELSESASSEMSEDTAYDVLNELGETLKSLKQEEQEAEKAGMESSDIKLDKQYDVEDRLKSIAQELSVALLVAENTEKYTKTVRSLAYREKDIMAAMFLNKLSDVKSELGKLRKDNQTMLASLEKRSFRITQNMRTECQEFLKALGYVCFSCDEHEAEAMCANLSKQNRTVATVSEDMDTIVFGDAPILRYFFSRGRPILLIDPLVARRDLGMSRDTFVDLCILCGTDFSGTIQGIGPHRALQWIQKHGSIEQVLEHVKNTKYFPQETFDYELARNVFNHLPPIPSHDTAYEGQKQSEPEIANLLQHYSIDPMEVNNKIRTALIQQNVVGLQNWGSDPFTSSKLSSSNILDTSVSSLQFN